MILPNYTSGATHGIFGCLDVCDPSGAHGWLMDASNPAVPLMVELRLGGNLVGNGAADMPRRDLSDISGFPVNCGFHVTWDKEALAAMPNQNSPLPLEAFHNGIKLYSRDPFLFSPLDISSLMAGEVLSVIGSIVRGRVLIPENMVIRVDLCQKEEIVASVYVGGEHGNSFTMVCPPKFFDGGWHKLEARFQNGTRLKGGEIAIDGAKAGKIVIDNISDGIITGWAASWLDPYSPPAIEVWAGGKLASTFKTKLYREDIAAELGITAFNGFKIPFPAGYGKNDAARITLRLKNEHVSINAGKTENAILEPEPMPADCFGYKINGAITAVTSSHVEGWAVDLAHPDEYLIVDIIVGNCNAGNTRACLCQERITTDGPGAGHAFHFRLPHGLEIYSPADARCVVRKTGQSLPIAKSVATNRLPVKHEKLDLYARPIASAPATPFPKTPLAMASMPKIEIIIINQNNAGDLENLFESLLAYNTYQNFTIAIVDHGSSDNSHELLSQWSRKLPLKIIERHSAYSRAESHNFAAFNSDSDILFFLSAKSRFCQNILGPMAAYIEAGEADIAGPRIEISQENQPVGPVFAQLGIYFSWREPNRNFTAYAAPLNQDSLSFQHMPIRAASVQDKCMMARREAFIKVGGFHEGYKKGLHDVDFCIAACGKHKFKILNVNDLIIWQSEFPDTEDQRDAMLLDKRIGAFMKGTRIAEWMKQGGLYSKEKPRIGFVVSEAKLHSRYGDIYTAFEFGEALRQLGGVDIVYLENADKVDFYGVDIGINLLHNFDLAQITNASPHLRMIAWPRNNFDRWLASPSLAQYDEVWAATRKGAATLAEKLGRPVKLAPIATNANRFGKGRFSPDLSSDYVFTGNCFGGPRQIASMLHPAELPYTFAVYGHGWRMVESFRPYWRGPASYGWIPAIYASTKILVDDANNSVVGWGGVNSRVFDALAAGALVITNSRLGSEELFDGILPWYDTPDRLKQLLAYYLENEEERKLLVEQLKRKVLAKHTYAARARDAMQSLERLGKAITVAINYDASLEDQNKIKILKDLIQGKGALARDISALDKQEIYHGADIQIDIWPNSRRNDFSTYMALIDWGQNDGNDSFYPVFYKRALVMAKAFANASIQTDSLFANDEEGVKFEASGLGEWRVLDMGAFQTRLSHWLDAVLSDCKQFQENRDNIPAPRRAAIQKSFQLAKISDPAPDKPVVIFWPDSTSTNPYQALLYKAVGNAFHIEAGDIATAQRLAESGKAVAFHLHWTSGILGNNLAYAESKKRMENFLETLSNFTRSGGAFVWTVHNSRSHECQFPELEEYLYQRLGSLASSIHVHSKKILELFQENMPLPTEKCFAGPHGNYLGYYPEPGLNNMRARLGVPKNALVFLFLGQLRAYKGLSRLLEAFNGIETALRGKTGRPLWLIVAGSPYNFDLGEIEGLKGDHSVIWPQRVPDGEIRALLGCADFMVLPYERILTSGSAYLALSFGLPVIAPGIGLLPEILFHGENAILYDPQKPAALENALKEAALMDGEALASMARAAAAAGIKHTWEEAGNGLSRAFAASEGSKWEEYKSRHNDIRALVHRPEYLPENRVGIAIIHYKFLSDTLRAIASAYGQGNIYVISNDARPDAFLAIIAAYPEITVVQAPCNLLFTAANNILLRMMIDNSPKNGFNYDYALLLNSDMELEQATVEQMANYMDMYPKAAFGSPCITFGDRPETVWYCGAEINWDNGMAARHWHGGENVADMPKAPFETGYASGACLMARVNALSKIGLMDEILQIYFDEPDWCQRAKKAGYVSMVFPDIIARHFKRSDKFGAPNDLYLELYTRNAFYITAKHQPDRLDSVEDFIRKQAEGWLKRIKDVQPERLKKANYLIEKSINEGKKLAKYYLGK